MHTPVHTQQYTLLINAQNFLHTHTHTLPFTQYHHHIRIHSVLTSRHIHGFGELVIGSHSLELINKADKPVMGELEGY